MSPKPISPTLHGVDDYLFSATQLLAPNALGFNPKAIKLYRLLGSNLFLYNLLTDYPAGAVPVFSYQTHRLIDILSVSGLGLLSFHKAIREDKRILGFHLGYTALAALHIVLTDWRTNKKVLDS